MVYFGTGMDKKESVLSPIDKIMFLITFIVLFLLFYFGSGYGFLNSFFISAGFTLICSIIRIIGLKLAKKINKNIK